MEEIKLTGGMPKVLAEALNNSPYQELLKDKQALADKVSGLIGEFSKKYPNCPVSISPNYVILARKDNGEQIYNLEGVTITITF